MNIFLYSLFAVLLLSTFVLSGIEDRESAVHLEPSSQQQAVGVSSSLGGGTGIGSVPSADAGAATVVAPKTSSLKPTTSKPTISPSIRFRGDDESEGEGE